MNCRDYVKEVQGAVLHAMNHEHPANMPKMLHKVTGELPLHLVGTESLLAGGLDKLVNELEGDAFEVRVAVCFHRMRL